MHLWRVRMEFNTMFCRYTLERSPYVGNDNEVHFEHIVVDVRRPTLVYATNACALQRVFHQSTAAATTRNINLFIVYKNQVIFFLFAFRSTTMFKNEYVKRNFFLYIWNDVVCSPNNNKNNK